MCTATYVCIHTQAWGHADGQVGDKTHSGRPEGGNGGGGRYQFVAHFLHAGKIGCVLDAEVICGTNACTSTLREDGRVYRDLTGQVVSGIASYVDAVTDNICHCGLHPYGSVKQSCRMNRSGDLPRS